MRILRLRLKNYRGIVDRTLEFPKTGVTIVEGPNEIGKSSIAEALDLVFQYRDSSKARHVLSVQPVDREVPTEIEVEVETGPYNFTYFKRFFKKPQTVLKISAPRAQTLKGRAAHERALEMLDETIDLALWRAMQVRQDEPVGQADLKDTRSLAQALDQVAGQETAGERELSLFEKVRAEYAVFFTETGQPRKPLKEAAEAEAAAAARKAEIERELQALERDVDRAAELEREIAKLNDDSAELAHAVEERENQHAELRKREEEVKRLELAAKSAKMSETMARKTETARRELLARAKKARARREELEAEAADRAPALREAEESLRAAREALAAAERDARAARELADLREGDFAFERAKLDYEQLGERRRRVRDARRQAEAARELIARTRVDAELLAEIERAHMALVEAEARLDAASPRLTVRALADVDVEIDGEPVAFAADETSERPVAERVRVVVPGRAEITVDAGTSVDELSARRDEARDALAARLAAAGVDSVAAARTACAQRDEARRTVEATEQIVAENLRDLTLDALDDKIGRLRAWVEGYPVERRAEPPLIEGHDEAYRARKEAQSAKERAEEAAEVARRDETAARDRVEQARGRAHEVDIELRLAAEAERAARTELEQARAEAPDLELERALREARERAREAEDDHARALRALQDAQPERVRQLAVDARRQADAAAARLREAQDERRDVAARLDLLGEQGLFEALQKATTAHERARRENGAVVRRAGAARVLYETMRDERDRARRAYAAPLREQIVRLGQYVFDEKLGIDLDDDLRIASRTLNGQTLPFDHLSAGAQEQLGLIGRVACALLVDREEGVPIIFDDTLGHSDPARLEGMGAMLGRAGETCQIIVLTCTPGRFRIAGSKTIRL